MAQTQWYNENRNRAYPFLQNTVGLNSNTFADLQELPDDILVDAGFSVGLYGEYDIKQDTVYLQEIKRQGDDVVFVFESTAPGLEGYPLLFRVNINDAPYQTYFSSNQPDSVNNTPATTMYGKRYYGKRYYGKSYWGGQQTEDTITESDIPQSCPPVIWDGFIVLGNPNKLATILEITQTVTRALTTVAVVEPSIILDRTNTYLNSLNIANEDRTRYTPPSGCEPLSWRFPTGEVFVRDTCLQGHIKFKQGFNCRILQNNSNNSITFLAVAGGGEGNPCEEVPLFDGESPAVNGINNTFSGAPRCGEVLTSINGLNGPNLTIIAGQGVSVINSADDHCINIDFDFRDLLVCLPE